MGLEMLVDAASVALFEIRGFIARHGSTPSLESIESQMQFIYNSAVAKKNPLDLVSKESPFTYGILSSREFASPEEMEIKKKLDLVTGVLNSPQQHRMSFVVYGSYFLKFHE